MRSGELPAYLSLSCLLNGIVSCSWCYFVQIQPISPKFNSCDLRTDKPSYRNARTHLIILLAKLRDERTKTSIRQYVVSTQNLFRLLKSPSAWTQSGRCLGQCSKWGIQSAVESRRSEVKVSLRYIFNPAAESANLVTAPELPMAAPTNNA